MFFFLNQSAILNLMSSGIRTATTNTHKIMRNKVNIHSKDEFYSLGSVSFILMHIFIVSRKYFEDYTHEVFMKPENYFSRCVFQKQYFKTIRNKVEFYIGNFLSFSQVIWGQLLIFIFY